MMQVANRTIRSLPQRTSSKTWDKIVEILCYHEPDARFELEKVSGIASMIISDRVCAQSPIIVECSGPTTHIFCLYDDDAIEGSDSNENAFGFNPLNGNWMISLPCLKDDMKNFGNYLKQRSTRVKLRVSDKKVSGLQPTVVRSPEDTGAIVIDSTRFMSS